MAKPPTTNVLIIGSGGREHALGWKLKQSPKVGKLFFAPGNGGTATLGENLNWNLEQVNTKLVDDIDYFCRHNDVTMVVIGPEDPLAQGLADKLAKPGRHVFGPVAAGARLEADKAYAKDLMKACSVPTADSKTFTNYDHACHYVEARETPVVVKAAGLAKGKGAIVTSTNEEALAALKLIMDDRAFGEAGDKVVIEERLIGQEVSILALVDGRNIFVLDPSQDHKQVGEGDTGPNTGGMGVYTPTPLIDDASMSLIEREVLVPTVDALRREGIDFKGVLYAGLMMTAGGPKVLEYNTRFGDPETQPLMMRLKGDLYDIFVACCEGRLDEVDLSFDKRVCICVVMCSGGYPDAYEKGKEITGIKEAEAGSHGEVKVFHAGTRLDKDGKLVTNGGRVLNVCAFGKTLKQAQERANAACEKIEFDGAFFRRDIGFRVM
ncbi:MAG: phosphoribosylamine--glycine ligase [Planctomycetota bacterium]